MSDIRIFLFNGGDGYDELTESSLEFSGSGALSTLTKNQMVKNVTVPMEVVMKMIAAVVMYVSVRLG